MTGISRKLPDTERAAEEDPARRRPRLGRRHRAHRRRGRERGGAARRRRAPDQDVGGHPGPRRGVLGAQGRQVQGPEEERRQRLETAGSAPLLLHGEPDLTIRVIRDVFNEDFKQLVVSGEQAWNEIQPYITSVAPDLADRVTKWTSEEDLFSHHRVDEQLAKAMDRKVWLPSRRLARHRPHRGDDGRRRQHGQVRRVGGNLEETVTKNNLEAAEEIVRQLRLRDIGGIIVIDFIDMVLESNRELVVRRLLECLGRDRTKHQVAEVTSLGLVQMTRKRVGSGLIEVFSETCEHCNGRGFIIHTEPVDQGANPPSPSRQRQPGGAGAAGRGASAAEAAATGGSRRSGRAEAADGPDGRPDRGRSPRRGHEERGSRRRRTSVRRHRRDRMPRTPPRARPTRRHPGRGPRRTAARLRPPPRPRSTQVGGPVRHRPVPAEDTALGARDAVEPGGRRQHRHGRGDRTAG